MGASDWVVHKFGGTSLADAKRIGAAADLVGTGADGRTAIVVSAMGGVTDALLDMLGLAAGQQRDYAAALDAIVDRHIVTARELVGDEAERLAEVFRADAGEVRHVLEGARVARSVSPQVMALVCGQGELWSAQLMAARLAQGGHEACWLNARDVLIVESGTLPAVQWETSGSRLAEWLDGRGESHVVITGFVATDPGGAPTTLQRNGSDFSASIFARLLGASSITIWTDVNGVMSADPRRVKEAVVLPYLSYDEAMELALFGAQVLHPGTMAPAVEDGIPITIRNARHPDADGTLIGPARGTTERTPRAAVKGLSTSDGIALLNVEGAGMIGVPGIAQRLFSALREVGVSVVMISQASSEHSICVAIPEAEGRQAKAAVERAFAAELLHGQIGTVELSESYSILAAVGDDMVDQAGVASRFFTSLANAGVNVRAIAQGSSERNISAVIAADDSVRALRAVHAGFYLSDQTLSVGIVGLGRVGGELVRQLRAQRAQLHERSRIDLRVRGVATSQRMLLDDVGIDLALFDPAAVGDVAADLGAFADHVSAPHLPNAVIIDCTASAHVAEHYAGWLARGIHVVTPNKKANSASFEHYQRLRDLGRARSTHYLYEATVGAGLPVITTLRDLIQTGDRVERIEGVLSGTLSFVFDELSKQRRMSEVVRDAHARGFTEPDPREDLSGMDVARKAVILAREAGLSLELDQVPVDDLVPGELAGGDVAAFLDRLSAYDGQMDRMVTEAAARDEVLRYAATIHADGRAEVGVRSYARDHPFARIKGGDNIIAFTTERYHELPLIVQGPGAGPSVTAGGVFADLLRLAAYVGAPS